MKDWYLVLLLFLLLGCTTQSAPEAAPTSILSTPQTTLPDLGEAPELTNEVWLNTPKPLRLANLRGQVILLEMWTFG